MATANQLLDVLGEQVSVLKELQETLQDEQKAIVGLDTTVMEILNSKKEQLIVRQRKLTDLLGQVMFETAKQFDLPQSATLTEIAEKSPASVKPQIVALQQKVKQIGSAVTLLANQNRGMLERFLGVVNDSLGYILRILNTSTTYGMRGTYLANAQSGAVMVNREA